jgi:hypothetical protein
MHWIRLHELHSSRFGRRNRDHVHRSIVGPSDDLHLSRARGQQSRNVVLLEHEAQCSSSELVTRETASVALRAAKGGEVANTKSLRVAAQRLH